MIIHPTHTCFDDVLEHQIEVARFDAATAMRQWIVHGILLFPDDHPRAGEPFAHAWVEDSADECVYQSGLLDGLKIWWGAPRVAWETAMRLQRKTRYTFRQALAENRRHVDFGPWEPDYRALCRRTEHHA